MKLDPMVLLFGMLAIGARKSSAPSGPPSLQIPKDGLPFTIEQLRALAGAIGFPDINLAAAVAMAESSGYADAVGDNGTSFGLWQIHTPAHREYDPTQLMDPTYNGHAALAISKQGTDWTPWSAFKNGKYAKYMPGVAGERPTAQLEPKEQASPAPAAAAEGEPLVVEVVGHEDDEDEDHQGEHGREASNGVDARVRISEPEDSPRRRRRARP